MAVGNANRTIQRIVSSTPTAQFGDQEAKVFATATALLGHIPGQSRAAASEFLVSWLALVPFLRDEVRRPGIRDFTAALCERVIPPPFSFDSGKYGTSIRRLRTLFQHPYDKRNFFYRPKMTLELLQRLSKGVWVLSNVGSHREQVPAAQNIQEMWSRAKLHRVNGRLCNIFGPEDFPFPISGGPRPRLTPSRLPSQPFPTLHPECSWMSGPSRTRHLNTFRKHLGNLGMIVGLNPLPAI